MSTLVLDCSVTLAWVCGEEATDAISRIFDAVVFEGALVPDERRLAG